jgi:hypothetical protein
MFNTISEALELARVEAQTTLESAYDHCSEAESIWEAGLPESAEAGDANDAYNEAAFACAEARGLVAGVELVVGFITGASSNS